MSSKLEDANDPVEPKPTDILSGRGKATYSHPGNKRYLQVINQAINEYVQEKTKVGKTAIVRGIVQQMTKEKRRFLQRDSKTENWYVLSRKAVLDKVGHSLRDMKQTKMAVRHTSLDPDILLPNNPIRQQRSGMPENAQGPTGDASARFPQQQQQQQQQPMFYGQLGAAGGLGGMPPQGAPGMLDQQLFAAHQARMAMLSGAGGAPGGAPGGSGGPNAPNLNAILEQTNMILKEREAIRALSATGAFGGVHPGLGQQQQQAGAGAGPAGGGSSQSSRMASAAPTNPVLRAGGMRGPDGLAGKSVPVESPGRVSGRGAGADI